MQAATTAKFTVQAGAFLNLENARKLRNNLQSDGYEVELGTKSIGGSLLNVVMVGKYASRAEAADLIKHLKLKYKLNGRLIEL